MQGNSFRRSSDQKQRINKEQSVEIDSPATSGGKGKYMNYVSFPWPPLEAEQSILNTAFFVKTNFF
jgi:hypothetical protein